VAICKLDTLNVATRLADLRALRAIAWKFWPVTDVASTRSESTIDQ
jgi:hypothetical protein